MFLSSRVLTSDSNSFDVERTSSAILRSGEFCSSLISMWANSIMHLSGVSISCVTLEVRRLSILFSAETRAKLLISEMSRNWSNLQTWLLKKRSWSETWYFLGLFTYPACLGDFYLTIRFPFMKLAVFLKIWIMEIPSLVKVEESNEAWGGL